MELYIEIQMALEKEIESSKQKYYNKVSQKLSSPSTGPRCYWVLHKKMLNNKKHPLFLLFSITINLSLTSKRKAKFSILIFLIHVQIPTSSTTPSTSMSLTNCSLHSFQFDADVKNLINNQRS